MISKKSTAGQIKIRAPRVFDAPIYCIKYFSVCNPFQMVYTANYLIGSKPIIRKEVQSEGDNSMGTLFKRGKKWVINYIDPYGRQIRKAISPYKETAQMILNKIEIEIAEGKYLDKKEQKNVLFEEFAGKYFDTYVKLENRNVRNQENLINSLVKQFKGLYLHQVDTMMIRSYLAKRAQTLRPSSVNKDLTMFKSMFNRAMEWGVYLGPNPTNGIKKLQENNERCRWLNEEEQARLLSHCQGISKFIVLTALKTGMRWGEIINLKWRQTPNSNYIDFDNDMIVVHESLSKSKKSRYIPLSPFLKSALKTLPKYPETDYVFWNPGKKRSVRDISASFGKAITQAKISDFKFHDLRHTFASQLVRSGVDLYVVQKLLGHASPTMTQRYAHLRSDQLKTAIEKMDSKINTKFEEIVYNAESQNSTNLAHRRFVPIAN